jgi:hypothetical protein
LVNLYGRSGNMHIVGIADYDDFMSMHAVLVVAMASSISRNDSRWMEESDLVSMLKEFESSGLMPYEPGERHGWSDWCARITVAVANKLERTVWELMAELFASMDGCGHRSITGIARRVDESGVQMLKDVFYIVTGVTTGDDGDGRLSSTKKASCMDRIPVKANEDLSWVSLCPMMDSDVCRIGACGSRHLTGLAPQLVEAEWGA